MTMRLVVIAILTLGGAAIGCGSGAGPATPTFSPFGSDPSAGAAEPTGGSSETPPAAVSGQSVAQLCTTDCARIAAACPSSSSSDCVSSCVAEPQMYPACATQVQALLQCYATAAITCSTSSGTSASACTAIEQALIGCISPGTTATGGAS